jgi:hypothetical protein
VKLPWSFLNLTATAQAGKFVGRYRKIPPIAVILFFQVFRVWDPDRKAKYRVVQKSVRCPSISACDEK